MPRVARPAWLAVPAVARPAWLRMPRGTLSDPRTHASIAVTAILVAVAAGLVVSGRVPGTRGVIPISPSPTVVGEPATASPAATSVSPAPTVAGNEAVGTAQPVATSAVVPPPPPPATPTPTPDPAVWRFEGRVVDEQGEPMADVCAVIGPHGCRPFGPHTDDRGVYYFDVPQNMTIVYELRFEKEGYATVYYRAQPSGPTVFDVVLRRS